jgi:hypothetical protein
VPYGISWQVSCAADLVTIDLHGRCGPSSRAREAALFSSAVPEGYAEKPPGSRTDLPRAGQSALESHVKRGGSKARKCVTRRAPMKRMILLRVGV